MSALQDELEQTRRALTLLARAAWNVCEVSEDHVSEEQGLARMNAIADLIGYPRPGGPPPAKKPAPPGQSIPADVLDDVTALGTNIEASLPGGWTFTLFVYEGRPGGQIAHLTRDPAASRAAVRRWLEHTEAPMPKARS